MSTWRSRSIAAEYIEMIADSLRYAKSRMDEVMFDAEHFFDGYKANPDYAMACLAAAEKAGARWLVLCDTNGGTLPHEIERIVGEVVKKIPGDRLGIHTHNDTENAVANTLAAVRAGVRQVQGTINGLGERCGNANMIALIPNLVLKMGFETGLKEGALQRLTHLSRLLDDRLNVVPNRSAAYVGTRAFAHKGGLHVSAVEKDPKTYEHVDPETVGNQRIIVVSDQAGRSNIMARFRQIGLEVDAKDPGVARLLEIVKEREAEGYAYDGADASFELLARHELHTVPDYFALQSFRVLAERRVNARGQLIALSEATVKLDVAGRRAMEVGEGNGPVNALDAALRKALLPVYPELADMRLVDFKVRILDSVRRHGRHHPRHDRKRRRQGQALVDHRRVAQHRRCLLQRPVRRHHLQIVQGRRQAGGTQPCTRRLACPAGRRGWGRVMAMLQENRSPAALAPPASRGEELTRQSPAERA